ncbi:hypothetical protein JCM19314_181 [Nonlabens ulvanivorans]|uniref:Uncharacterized protein n=1 Tax=Nonlabens ulvanivorans TaxID=906888 RepID=A0A090QCZ8_NONUL|nr:hypothetical protein [Nonlabens ulvanivorans]GAL00955.1 hypothetical protein JCM19314_181 [Nonlabens ulvanivorans]
MNKHLLIVVIFFSIFSNAQEHEYLGFLKLPDSTFISYKVNFTEKEGFIKGYSYTDMNGDHETKSSIVGRFNDRKNTLEFREVSTIYTKSDITELDFCYVYFTGKTRKLNGKAAVEGTFKSYYDDLTSCIDGELSLNAADKIEKRTERFERLVAKSNKIADSTKQKIDMNQFMSRFEDNRLKGGEKVNIIWNQDYLKLMIWDPGTVDGDIIKVTLNGKDILSSYSTVKKQKELELQLTEDVNTIIVTALNEGKEAPPNTAKIKLSDGKGETIDLLSSLVVGEEVTLVFYKEKPQINKK